MQWFALQTKPPYFPGYMFVKVDLAEMRLINALKWMQCWECRLGFALSTNSTDIPLF